MSDEPNRTCYCCGTRYVRGKFRCCKQPQNMRSDRWLEMFCRVDIGNGKHCNKCPRCGCEHRERQTFTGTEISWNSISDIAPAFKNRGEVRQFAERWSPHNS